MFGDNKKKQVDTANDSYAANTIQNGTVISGDINSSGNIRIDGKLKGTLTTKAKLVIGASGEIVGDVHCQNANIQGKIEGTLQVSGQLHLLANAIIEGDIVTKKLIVEEGAQFNGSCTMSAVSKLTSSSNKDNDSEKTIEKQAV